MGGREQLLWIQRKGSNGKKSRTWGNASKSRLYYPSEVLEKQDSRVTDIFRNGHPASSYLTIAQSIRHFDACNTELPGP